MRRHVLLYMMAFRKHLRASGRRPRSDATWTGYQRGELDENGSFTQLVQPAVYRLWGFTQRRRSQSASHIG